ncbi:MAG: hypothetical protein HWD63_02385 [Candidatus Parvibacillus calidus]|nr:MAG: hypothetical protein HWD63_02385 [Candidatus Parvibacillus calidus]
MKLKHYIVLIFLAGFAISVHSQPGRIYVVAKPLADGRFVSRIITLDSAETQRLNGARIKYQRFENKNRSLKKYYNHNQVKCFVLWQHKR